MKKKIGKKQTANLKIANLKAAVMDQDRLLMQRAAEARELRATVDRLASTNKQVMDENFKLTTEKDAILKEAQLQSKRVKFLLDRVAVLEVTVFTLSRVMTESRKAAAEMVYGLNLSNMPSVLTQKPAAPKAQG